MRCTGPGLGRSELVRVALRQAAEAQVAPCVQHRHHLAGTAATVAVAAGHAAATPALVATAHRRLCCLAGSFPGSQAPDGVQQHAMPLRHCSAGRHLTRQHPAKPAGHPAGHPAQPGSHLALHRLCVCRRACCRRTCRPCCRCISCIKRCFRCCCGRPLLRAECGGELLLLLLEVTGRARQAHACDTPRQAQQRSSQRQA